MAKMVRSGKVSAQLEKARARRLELDAERIRQEQHIEELLADYLAVEEDEERIREQLAECERRRGYIIAAMRKAGEKEERVMSLCQLTRPELRRLTAHIESDAAAANPWVAAGAKAAAEALAQT